jgi:hypothetical protein
MIFVTHNEDVSPQKLNVTRYNQMIVAIVDVQTSFYER